MPKVGDSSELSKLSYTVGYPESGKFGGWYPYILFFMPDSDNEHIRIDANMTYVLSNQESLGSSAPRPKRNFLPTDLKDFEWDGNGHYTRNDPKTHVDFNTSGEVLAGEGGIEFKGRAQQAVDTYIKPALRR